MDLDFHHGPGLPSWTWTSSIDMGMQHTHRHALWTWTRDFDMNMDMQRELRDAALTGTWILSLDGNIDSLKDACQYPCWRCIDIEMDMQHEHGHIYLGKNSQH
jgi:hypothetical protein